MIVLYAPAMRSKQARRETRKSIWSQWFWVPAVLAGIACSACGTKAPTGAEEGPSVVSAPSAPAFDLVGLDGARHRLGDYSGRVLLIEFWATWCGPCRLQAEILARLYTEVRGEDVEFLAVSLGESADIVRDFVVKDPFPYPVAIDPEETLGYALEVYALPTVVIIDSRGRIRFMRPGITDAGTLQQALEEAAAAG